MPWANAAFASASAASAVNAIRPPSDLTRTARRPILDSEHVKGEAIASPMTPDLVSLPPLCSDWQDRKRAKKKAQGCGRRKTCAVIGTDRVLSRLLTRLLFRFGL
ncbi:hypothetical protein K431DRAFT_289245 [Polychaeton citri CBS 116435]|uniref:Uncharacterized protein n=1 Tax=Polychaeton citri CBS 116435 TaxID=1314669 RepID=A0A9P4Q1X6_9PEZI|nr:hypothetical protein K431DRAFT_289245 [Polychaeton citri CBS 116435]